MERRILNLLYTIIVCSTISAQTVRYVTVTGAGSNDGSSWSNAFAGLQSALNIASSGEQIWVAKGTYYPTSAYDLTNSSRYYHFRMIGGVAIYGGFVGTESLISERLNYGSGEANETILSGDIGTVGNSSDNCYHVFYHPNLLYLTSSAILDGFTIKGGFANGTNPHSYGAGMYNYDCDPTIQNCIFSSNASTDDGGGMFNTASSDVTISNCTFNGNSAKNGGGIFNGSSSPSISSCVFSSNTVTQSGGGLSGTFSFITSSIFSNNYAAYYGGGIITTSSSNLKNCAIVDNTANIWGGGVYTSNNPTFINCTIAGNNATSRGGGMYKSSGYPIFNNSVIWGNTVTTAGNYGKQIYNGTSSEIIALNYSCISNGSNDVTPSGTVSLSSSITTDPVFVLSGLNKYALYGSSQCLDSGNDSYISESYDIRGSSYPRKLNKTNGSTGTVDMGAYEYKYAVDFYDINGPLPVEIILFKGFVSKDNVTLIWKTATEINNYGFNVECRIKDGVWKFVGFVQGNGNSNSLKNYTFTDNNPPRGNVQYRLKQIDLDGSYEYSVTIELWVELLHKIILEQNHPNPFNPTTTISYQLPTSGLAILKVYDILGKEIDILVNEFQQAGKYKIEYNASNLGSGIYFYRLQFNNSVETKNFSFVK